MSYIKTKKEVIINSRTGEKSFIAFRKFSLLNAALENPITRFTLEICKVSAISIKDFSGNDINEEVLETIENVETSFVSDIYDSINFSDTNDVLENFKVLISENSENFFQLKLEDLEIINN